MSEPFLATTPEPPYYAVIFSNRRGDADATGYGITAERMVELAARVPGFLGIESVRDADGHGITVSYWASEDAIAAWGRDAEHLRAQAGGRERWYDAFRLRVAHVTEERTFDRKRN